MQTNKIKKEAKKIVSEGKKIAKNVLGNEVVKDFVADEKKLIKRTLKKAIDKAKKKLK